MTILFANNASSTLASSIDDDDLTIQVETGDGALFPSPTGDDYFILTLQNSNGDIERVKITARSTDLLTVPSGGRGQEGTSAQTWTTGDRVELRMSAGSMEAMLQKTGGAMTGDVNMQTNELQNARLTGTTVVEGGKTVGTVIRGAENDASNQISVPSNGTQATAGGSAIITASTLPTQLASVLMAAFPSGSIIMWFGTTGNIPSGWALCDGNNGTPNFANRFPVGAGGLYAKGSTGGSSDLTASTSSNGGHDHGNGGNTGGHTLTTDELPSHSHGSFSATTTHNTGLNSGDPINMVVSNNGTTASKTIAGSSSGSAGGGQSHSHPIATDGAHTHSITSVSILNPYAAVYFIMKL